MPGMDLLCSEKRIILELFKKHRTIPRCLVLGFLRYVKSNSVTLIYGVSPTSQPCNVPNRSCLI